MKWLNCSVVFLSFCFSAPVYPSSGDDMDHFSSETKVTDKQRVESLFRAPKTNDIETLKTILKSNKSLINETEKEGMTLLHVAAIGNSVEVLKLLLPFYNIDHRNNFYETPAYLAARAGKPEALHFLLQNGADPYVRDNQNSTLMHAAVRSGQVDVVRELTPYKQLINIPNKRNVLPIEIISNMQIVKELVDAGSIITDYSIYRYVYPYVYSHTQKKDIVKYLVVKSGKVNVRITWSTRDCRDSLLMILLYIIPHPIDMIKFILDQGADVNIKYCKNITALHIAAYYETEHSLEIVHLLRSKGADINSPDDEGYTPLDFARRGDNRNVFYYLWIFGAVTKDMKDSGKDSLGTTTEDDKSMLYSLGTTTEDDNWTGTI